MASNEACGMPAFNSITSTPISEELTPIYGQILVTNTIEQTYERISITADEVCDIPLSDEPWKFYSVPTDKIKPILSSWHQILSAPGIFVVSSSRWHYRIAVNSSYIAWLRFHDFTFQELNTAADSEKAVQGICAATWNLDARFVEDAVHAISLRCHQGLESTYRNYASSQQLLPIEWAIMWRDMGSDLHIWSKFGQGLVIFVLGCCDNYNTSAVRALLGKNEKDIFNHFQKLYRESSAYPKKTVANHEVMGDAQLAAEFHKLTILRDWFDFLSMKRDNRQHKRVPQYTATEDSQMISSILGVQASKPFGNVDTQKMLNALSKCALFPGKTVLTLEKLGTQMIARIPVKFLNGYLDPPSEIQARLNIEQEKQWELELTSTCEDWVEVEAKNHWNYVIVTKDLDRNIDN
ncbi:uncharacterized protein RAG0_03046 [Rhynchosporium agropyri]|uniref:Uncharacterized protein n=1 Tax=Rhynchosporium agropyri TaxID=914238 RepID=A0A1E1K327_9HELO|nr:uncharacterized protein RAG0_03046 [Rhynchosporium agropyri]